MVAVDELDAVVDELDDVVDVVGVDAELLEFAWIAVCTACWSAWTCVIWAVVKPKLDSTAAVSV
jgi:hypothetical protein